MLTRILAYSYKAVRPVLFTALVLHGLPALAQNDAVSGPKKPGTVRIGLLMPENQIAGGDARQAGEPIREAEGALLTGPNLESVKLHASLPDQAMLEAKALNCDYLLSSTLSQQVSASGGRFGKLRAFQVASSAAVFLPGGSAIKQIGAVGAQVAQQTLASAAQGVKANADVTLHYTLTAVDGHLALDESAKTHSKSNGENVITPLLTEAATKIVAVAKPVVAPAMAAETPAASAGAIATTASSPAALTTYRNYDFVPGDKPIFVDDFSATQDGEFPEKWELIKGQGTVNQQAGSAAFVITSGGPARMKLRMTQANYLGNQFTLEFDIFGVDSQWGPAVYFSGNSSEEWPNLTFRPSKVLYCSPNVEPLEGPLPDDISIQKFLGRWHHIAIAYKQPQMKVYVDQYRVLYVPDTKSAPQAIAFGGVAGTSTPVVFRDVRLATGGGANYIGKQFTEAKIVVHGINFDLDKATLRPESMGPLNQIAKLMSSDASLKFEIDGHTDNSGNPSHNVELSQQRAEAVKQQLISMGIDASRLTTKGLGDTKPLGPNDTPENRANNRRVEFIRL
ncbi:MAG TPA: OmpA family protein [Terriglobales bacterium]|nr:OmpA family protein [Terriglobales bacterium]